MAEETNAGAADSTIKIASVCGLLSAGVAALLSAYPLVFCYVHQLLFPCLEGYFSTSCSQLQGPPRMLHQCRVPSCLSCRRPCIATHGCKALLGCCINVERLHVSHADVLVLQPTAAMQGNLT